MVTEGRTSFFNAEDSFFDGGKVINASSDSERILCHREMAEYKIAFFVPVTASCTSYREMQAALQLFDL